MTAMHDLTDEELHRAGLEALERELGTVGMVRFLQLLGVCKGDYTAERQEWIGGLTLDEIEKGIGRLRQQKSERGK